MRLVEELHVNGMRYILKGCEDVYYNGDTAIYYDANNQEIIKVIDDTVEIRQSGSVRWERIRGSNR